MASKVTDARFGRMVLHVGASAGLAALSAACSQTSSVDPPVWEETGQALEVASAKSGGHYFQVRRDMRKCVYPLCGGYFVKAVNRPRTRCADGTFAPECYVAELSAAPNVLPDAATVVVRGLIESNVFPDFGDMGRLVATDVWGSATDAEPSGAFFRVSDSGIACITTPCPTIALERLNSRFRRRASNLDFTAVGATEEQILSAWQAYTEGTLIVSGRVKNVDPDLGPTLMSTQFYLPVEVPSCESDADCEDGYWCRGLESGGNACVPFVGVGESCGGFTLPWYYEQCQPGLVCDTPMYVADAPGVCRAQCKSNDDCAEEEYCTPSGVCRGDGTCHYASDCATEGNAWPHIECVGYPTCPYFGDGDQCGWQCGAPECIDLIGVDFGPCDAVLGYGVIFGQCTGISGCGGQGHALFETLEECQSLCAK